MKQMNKSSRPLTLTQNENILKDSIEVANETAPKMEKKKKKPG